MINDLLATCSLSASLATNTTTLACPLNHQPPRYYYFNYYHYYYYY